MSHISYRRTRLFIRRHVSYPLFLQRRYWSSITRLEALLLVVYIVLNGVALGVGIQDGGRLIYLRRRSAIMASINMIPLFMGGRTSCLAETLGVPRHAYYLAHHWVGRVVIAQGLLHSILVITSAGFHVSGIVVISGVVVSHHSL